MNTILEIKNLHYYYNDIHALKGINFHVNEGEVVSLIGANGAGKTTTMRSISGLIDGVTEGEILFHNTDIARKKPYAIAKLGITQSLEGRQIFSALTVEENLRMGAYLEKDNKVIQEEIKKVYAMFPRLKERKDQNGGTLSGGEQQMLAIGRALMSRPQILLLDEPSLGLAPLVVKDIFQVIQRINKEGITILLVEQNSRAALQIAHRGYVLETGKIIMEGQAHQLLDDPQVQKSYLGV